MALNEQEIANRFTYHAPTPEKVELHQEIREMALDFAQFLNANVPVSRELSSALTKLDETVFWANAAIARN